MLPRPLNFYVWGWLFKKAAKITSYLDKSFKTGTLISASVASWFSASAILDKDEEMEFEFSF